MQIYHSEDGTREDDDDGLEVHADRVLLTAMSLNLGSVGIPMWILDIPLWPTLLHHTQHVHGA